MPILTYPGIAVNERGRIKGCNKSFHHEESLSVAFPIFTISTSLLYCCQKLDFAEGKHFKSLQHSVAIYLAQSGQCVSQFQGLHS